MARVIFHATDNNYTVANDNVSITGSDNASESIIIQSGVTGVVIDAAIEKVEVADGVGNYTYKANGTLLEVYSGGVKVIDIPANPLAASARQIAFSDGTVDVSFGDGDEIKLGGTIVADKDSDAAIVTPVTIDATNKKKKKVKKK
jgi:hypothetical protein